MGLCLPTRSNLVSGDHFQIDGFGVDPAISDLGLGRDLESADWSLRPCFEDQLNLVVLPGSGIDDDT